MRKIIHLSDTHVGYGDLAAKLGDIVTEMISQRTPAEDYVVVVTGDSVDDATREGSYEEASVHFDRLKEAGSHVLVVPGNHDYGGGSLGYPEYVGTFKEHFYGKAEVGYPKLDLIDNIAFVGLDSMAEELNWYDRLFADGELGKEQLKRLGGIFGSESVRKSEYVVVYLHHHPFHPWPLHQLKDSEELREALKAHSVDALLFGHNHEGLALNGTWGIKWVYDGGTSTGKDGGACPIRVIDLSGSSGGD